MIVETGARAARAGEASPSRKAAARPAAARAEPKLVLWHFVFKEGETS